MFSTTKPTSSCAPNAVAEEHCPSAVRNLIVPRFLLLVIPLLAAPRLALTDHEPIFPVAISVTSDESGAVVDRAWIDAEMAAAEKMYGALGFHVRIHAVTPIGTELAHIEDPRMRDRFAPLVTQRELNVFIVRSLRDNEQVGVYRGGVTWDSHTTPSRRYIILSASAFGSTLAHEMGHFFGLQPHSSVHNNLMSYDRDDALVFLDSSQQSIVRNTARYLRTSSTLNVLDWIDR